MENFLNNMSEFVKGSCDEFCPKAEKQMRTKEHLLHFYELQSEKKYLPGTVIKAFSRSAAGAKAPKSSDLRTVSALKKTVEYLLTKILLDKRKPFYFVYDFIFDRLRCVRQEIVIQNLDAVNTIKLLEPIVLFLAYSRYKLCRESHINFDPKICESHMQECLKIVLSCYDVLDLNYVKQNCQEQKSRRLIEALYQIFNLGRIESLERTLLLPKNIQDSVFCIGKEISLEYYRGNYYRVLQGIKKLPHILCAIAFLKVPEIRRKVLHCFSYAYSCKNVTVPLKWLQQLLLYQDLGDIINDCTYYNICVLPDKASVRFSKSDFSTDKSTVECRPEFFIDEKLNLVFIPDILLSRE